MEQAAEITSNITAEGQSSSLRTQLIEAQILDCQLEGDEYGLGNLISSERSASMNDYNVEANKSAIKDIDDTILNLRRWHLDREISKEELIVNMMEASQLDAQDIDESSNTLDSNHREEISRKYEFDHDLQVSRTKTSLATIESLLHPKTSLEGSQLLIDLSRLADQDKVISSEFKWSLQAIEKLEKEIDDSNFRRIIDEARSSSKDETRQMEKNIINSDNDLETEFTSISDRFQYFSSALDSILLQSDEVEDVNIKKNSDCYLPVESQEREVRSIASVNETNFITTPLSAPAIVAPKKPIAAPMTALKVRNSQRIKDDVTSASPVRVKSVRPKSGNRGSNRLPIPPTASQTSNVSWK